MERNMIHWGPKAISPSTGASVALPTYGREYAALETWVLRRLGRADHEWRVTRIALALFDLLRRKHKLNHRARDVLALSALVHDVGRCIDQRTHPRQGARLILKEKDLPLGETLRRRLAYLTLYHRGPVPAPGEDGVLLAGEDTASVRLILGLLRAADALDSRRTEPPQLRFTHTGRRLRVHCHLRTPSAKARKVYSRRKKFRLLEETLGCRVQLRVRCGEELMLVG
jgi:exopolyphosphatase/guanosine-5'-triphosphate,3'-diphosphate pyrophosphatase